MSTSFNAANSVLRSVTSPAMKSTPAGRSFGRPYGWTFGSRLSKTRSEEHTSELQSRLHLVCRLLLEKKKSTHDIDAPHNGVGIGELHYAILKPFLAHVFEHPPLRAVSRRQSQIPAKLRVTLSIVCHV